VENGSPHKTPKIIDRKRKFKDKTPIDPSKDSQFNEESKRTLIPCPSSLKNLLADSTFYDKLSNRLKEEQMETHNSSKMTTMTNGIKFLANGNYGTGANSYHVNRIDSRSRKRQQ
jgi:hypothetical protein